MQRKKFRLGSLGTVNVLSALYLKTQNCEHVYRAKRLRITASEFKPREKNTKEIHDLASI